MARFRDEAKVVVKLSHGNLVPVFDAGMAGGLGGDELYLAMELRRRQGSARRLEPLRQEGDRLSRRRRGLHRARAVPRARTTRTSFSTLKLVHRDVSPPNVLLSFFGEVKLTDFGLASSTLKTEKTAPGVVYGKVSYMSPEQARGELLDGRTDLYAVGIILWELLTGRQLFPQSEPKLIERVRDPERRGAVDLRAARAAGARRHRHEGAGQGQDAALRRLRGVPRGAGRLPGADGADHRYRRAWRASSSSCSTTRSRTTATRASGCSRTRARWAAAERATGRKRPWRRQQTVSQPETVSLHRREGEAPTRRAAPTTGDGIIGTYIDGKYLIRRLIGEGGMGLVYEAEHVEIGRRVAVKVLHAMYTRQTEVVARFRSEARAATRIGHPHIIDVFDSGTTVDGAVYFVMEFLEGRDLSQLIEEEGPLPAARAIAIAREICQALMAAHKAGILHRDLKPENVFLIERDGNRDFVKVLDFGIAKTLEAVTERVGRLTNPGVAMGTPEYMAPEQAAGADRRRARRRLRGRRDLVRDAERAAAARGRATSWRC